MTAYHAFCDDFFVNMELQTSLGLPDGRETILQFFEICQKQFPDLGAFYRRETGEYILEGNREKGSYRWIELSERRIVSGFFNPSKIQDALNQHIWVLERCKYFLGISHLDIECLDVLYGFNMDFAGNRDAVVSQALLANSPLNCFSDSDEFKLLGFEPSMIISLDDDCYMQARVSLETRPNSYQVRTGNFDSEPISVYFTVRGYPSPESPFNMEESFMAQSQKLSDLTERFVLPRIIQPIAAAIATGL